MPTVEYFLVCRSVQKDIITDEISYINVLENIAPEEFPDTIPRVVAVSLWNLSALERDNDYQATLVVKVPGETDVAFQMNLSHGTNQIRAVQGVLEIPVKQAGQVQFEVLLNGVHGASHTINILPPGARQELGGERDG